MKAAIVAFVQRYREIDVKFVDDTIQAAEVVVNLTGAGAYVTLPKYIAMDKERYPDDIGVALPRCVV